MEEATTALTALGLPVGQRGERSALTLLALLGLGGDTPWSEASGLVVGLTPIMGFIAEHYGKTYAAGTRASFQRDTMRPFLEAGLVLRNPDEPGRALSSSKTAYQIEPNALRLLQVFGTSEWDRRLPGYVARAGAIARKHAHARRAARISVTMPDGETLTLSPGRKSALVKEVLEKFCGRYAPGGRPLYVGDAQPKHAFFDEPGLQALGVTLDSHGKMPDVVVHRTDKDWLLLIEAVTSHGPVNPKRHKELSTLFASARPGLVFVTAFLTRRVMAKYLGEISWETEVWVAEDPDHLIHFDGERFLGPYRKG